MSLLANLTKTAKKAEKIKADRPAVAVPDEAIDAFERFAYADAIMGVATSRKEAESEVIKEVMLQEFSKTLFENGSMPDNPLLQKNDADNKPDISGIFQVQQRYKINIPNHVDGNDNIENRFLNALTNAGIDKDKAKKLIDGEIDARPIVMLRSFSELVEGHYESKTFVEASDKEKEIGEKLLQFVLDNSSTPLTEDERAIAVRQQDKIKVKDGFLQRLRQYCSSLDEVNAVLKVITPVHYVSHVKVGKSDTPEQLNQRLATEAYNLFAKKKLAMAA